MRFRAMQPRIVADGWVPIKKLQLNLQRALDDQTAYTGTDPVLVGLHEVNVKWRQDILHTRIQNSKHETVRIKYNAQQEPS